MLKERESNYELLRIIAILGVVILHSSSYFFENEVGNFYETTLLVIHSIFICSVNIFLIITGFFMYNKNSVTIDKPLSLYLQNTFFSVLIFFIAIIQHKAYFSVKGFMFRFIPGTWFLVIYIAMFLLIPFINMTFINLCNKKFRLFLVILAFIVSVWTTGVDVLFKLSNTIQMNGGGYSPIGANGSQDGHTIVNFIFMYFIGAYIRRTDLKIKTKLLLPSIIINTLLIFICIRIDFTIGEEYCNPLVILNAVLIFLFFKNVSVKSRTINRISSASFTVYILHLNFLFIFPRNYLVMENKLIVLPKFFFLVVGIYLICWLIWEIYNNTLNRLFNKLIFEKHKIIICNGVKS